MSRSTPLYSLCHGPRFITAPLVIGGVYRRRDSSGLDEYATCTGLMEDFTGRHQGILSGVQQRQYHVVAGESTMYHWYFVGFPGKMFAKSIGGPKLNEAAREAEATARAAAERMMEAQQNACRAAHARRAPRG